MIGLHTTVLVNGRSAQGEQAYFNPSQVTHIEAIGGGELARIWLSNGRAVNVWCSAQEAAARLSR